MNKKKPQLSEGTLRCLREYKSNIPIQSSLDPKDLKFFTLLVEADVSHEALRYSIFNMSPVEMVLNEYVPNQSAFEEKLHITIELYTLQKDYLEKELLYYVSSNRGEFRLYDEEGGNFTLLSGWESMTCQLLGLGLSHLSKSRNDLLQLMRECKTFKRECRVGVKALNDNQIVDKKIKPITPIYGYPIPKIFVELINSLSDDRMAESCYLIKYLLFRVMIPEEPLPCIITTDNGGKGKGIYAGLINSMIKGTPFRASSGHPIEKLNDATDSIGLFNDCQIALNEVNRTNGCMKTLKRIIDPSLAEVDSRQMFKGTARVLNQHSFLLSGNSEYGNKCCVSLETDPNSGVNRRFSVFYSEGETLLKRMARIEPDTPIEAIMDPYKHDVTLLQKLLGSWLELFPEFKEAYESQDRNKMMKLRPVAFHGEDYHAAIKNIQELDDDSALSLFLHDIMVDKKVQIIPKKPAQMIAKNEGAFAAKNGVTFNQTVDAYIKMHNLPYEKIHSGNRKTQSWDKQQCATGWVRTDLLGGDGCWFVEYYGKYQLLTFNEYLQQCTNNPNMKLIGSQPKAQPPSKRGAKNPYTDNLNLMIRKHRGK